MGDKRGRRRDLFLAGAKEFRQRAAAVIGVAVCPAANLPGR